MYSTRRELTKEEHQLVINAFVNHQRDLAYRLMGMLVDENNGVITPSKSKRTRKQGINERHPIDLFNKSRQSENTSLYSNTVVDRDEKQGWFRRSSSISSIRSSVSSRKSSARSCYSTSTVKTSTSTIKKNSGNFDGLNIRKKSLKERKLSLPCNSNKSSVSDQEKFITAFYQNLKKIDDETSSESSFSDDGEKFDTKARTIDLCIQETSNYRRTKEYVLQHANVGNYGNENEDSVFIDTEEDEGFHPETPKPFTKDEKKSYNKDAAKSKSSTSKKVSKRLSQQSSTFTNHKEIDSKRLNALLFDFNSNFIPNKFDTVPKGKLNRAKSLPPRPRGLHKHVITEASSSDQQKIKKEALNEIQDESDISVSTDSAHGSTRSISTASSDTFSSYNYNSPRASVPMNFIPGLTTPQQGRPRNRSLPVSLTVFRKASFCFKGVTCRIYQNSPRTYRALAHAGCVALIIPAPESHKCKH